jgi:alpha-galactosidase
VDQDPLGVQGKQVRDANGIHVIVKPLKDGSEAVAVFNETDTASDVSVDASEIGLKKTASYRLRDLWQHTQSKGDGSIKAHLPAHGIVMYRISHL